MPSTVGRWGLRVPVGGDAPAVPLWLTNLATDLSNVAMDDQGTLAARPVSTVGAPSVKPGRYWYVTGDSDATQNGRLWRDTGAGWVEVVMAAESNLAAGLPSRRTLGTSATSAAAGNDARLSNQRAPTSPEAGLRIIRGSLSGVGVILVGSGFTVAHPLTGTLTITYGVAFSGRPTVVVSIGVGGMLDAMALVSESSASACQVKAVNPAGADADQPIEFVAVGPA